MSPQTQRVLDFLTTPASYPHGPERVTMVQTHASWVFIATPYVWKIKKPVDLGFLDFSTLGLRREDCEREVTLNRRLAPDMYLGVEAIREERGRLRFGGTGTIVEWCVKMRELDPRFFLTHLLRAGTVDAACMDRIIALLQSFYASQPAPPQAEVETALDRQRLATEGNFRVALEWIGRSLSQAAYDALTRFTDTFYACKRELLESRMREGWIRDCHGDLHAEHIHLTPDAVRVYDCIEFNTRFRYIDVASDLAFLAMDLDRHGRTDLSTYLVDKCSVLLHDTSMRRLMDFYQCYRACVRGKVESLHSAAETAGDAERAASLAEAQSYFRLALRYALAGSRPRAFLFMGRPASGKSALAGSLASETGWPVFSSDALRKGLAGIPLHHRGDAAERTELYSTEMTRRTYAELLQRAIETLKSGRPVILDATFSRAVHREEFRNQLRQAGFEATWIEATASDAAIRERLGKREHAGDVVSDARLEDYATLSRLYEPPEELDSDTLLRLDTGSPPEDSLRQLMTTLAERHAQAD